MPGKKKFGDEDPEEDERCPKCSVTLTERDRETGRCRNGHALG